MKFRLASGIPLAAGLISLVLALGAPISEAPAQVQDPGSPVPMPIPAGKPQPENVTPGVPEPTSSEVRSGIGMLEEVPNGVRQSGDVAVTFERRKADELHDSLRQLLLAVVEGDALGVSKLQADCQTRLEVLEENNPADVLRDDLVACRARLEDPKRGDPASALLRLQLDVEQLNLLYPLQDLEHSAAEAKRLEAAGKADACRDVLDAMMPAVALPDLDEPIQQTDAAFQAAVKAIDTKREDEARQQIKAALGALAQLPSGTFLVESEWFIAQASRALGEGLRAIAAGNLRNARALIEAAGTGAQSARRDSYASILKDVDNLISASTSRMTAPMPADMRALILRIDKEL